MQMLKDCKIPICVNLLANKLGSVYGVMFLQPIVEQFNDTLREKNKKQLLNGLPCSFNYLPTTFQCHGDLQDMDKLLGLFWWETDGWCVGKLDLDYC